MADGRCLPVEQLLDISKGANRKIGVAGKRHMCKVNHGLGDYRQRALWRDGDNWYVWEAIEDEVS